MRAHLEKIIQQRVKSLAELTRGILSAVKTESSELLTALFLKKWGQEISENLKLNIEVQDYFKVLQQSIQRKRQGKRRGHLVKWSQLPYWFVTWWFWWSWRVPWYPELWGPCQHKPQSKPAVPHNPLLWPGRGGGGGLMRVKAGRRRDTPAPWRSLRQLICSLTMIAPVKITAKIHSQPGTG